MHRLKRVVTALPVLAMVASVTALSPTLVSSAAAAPAQTLACGAVLTANTVLAGDVGPCSGNGLTIGANDVRLNLNGHKVLGALNSYGTGAASDSVGIHFDSVSGATVTNGEVADFAAGVRIDFGGDNTVTQIDAHDNISPIGGNNNGDGISVWNSSYNTIRSNVVTHNGQYSGITLVTGPYAAAANGIVNPAMSGTGNRILDNLVTNNNVAVCGAPTCTPVATKVTVPKGSQVPGPMDQGIRVEGPNMTNTDVERNTVTDAGNNGILVDASCHDAFLVPLAQVTCTGDVGNIHTLVKDNVSNHNGYGRTQGFGINLFGMGVSKAVQAIDETVVGNTTEYNVNSGIILYSTRAGPRGPGLFSTPGSCNDHPANDPQLCAATDDTVVGNNSSFNGLNLGVSLGGNNGQGDGIELSPGADRNTVSHNTVNSNGYDGIAVEMAQVYDANHKPVFDSNGNPVYVTGGGALNNVLDANEGAANQYLQGEDQNPGCGTNDWDHSSFVTVSQPCVLDSDQPGDPTGGGAGQTSITGN